jgi:succinate-acetate transporter protein
MSDVEKVESPHHAHRPSRTIGNPAPLGLYAFASTTLVLSLYNVHARHVETPNVVIGMALFYGGLAQLLAGMWEFATGNTFGATAFSSYGGFWLSFATLFIPDSGIAAAYATGPAGQEHDALGIYLLSWMVVTFLFFIGSLRKSIGLTALFFFLTLTFMVLAISELLKKDNIGKAGGYLGIITALIAYYCGTAELLGRDGVVELPLGKHQRLD